MVSATGQLATSGRPLARFGTINQRVGAPFCTGPEIDGRLPEKPVERMTDRVETVRLRDPCDVAVRLHDDDLRIILNQCGIRRGVGQVTNMDPLNRGETSIVG